MVLAGLNLEWGVGPWLEAVVDKTPGVQGLAEDRGIGDMPIESRQALFGLGNSDVLAEVDADEALVGSSYTGMHAGGVDADDNMEDNMEDTGDTGHRLDRLDAAEDAEDAEEGGAQMVGIQS